MYRYRFLITAFTLTALTILLTVASSPAQAAPRSIPWDCSDWQESPAVADADDARVSMILETLAANRGKAIYCAIDQSDTWTKSETWLAGRDRNERDDTVYFGQSGNFRGFLSAQENYLTDGESGVGGQSIDRIFEFPEEERRRRWRTIVTDSEDVVAGSGANNPVISVWCPYGIGGTNDLLVAQTQANNRCTNPRTRPAGIDLLRDAKTAARAHCRTVGYHRARNVALEPITYVYSPDRDSDPNNIEIRARETRQWTATCQKTKRVRR